MKMCFVDLLESSSENQPNSPDALFCGLLQDSDQQSSWRESGGPEASGRDLHRAAVRAGQVASRHLLSPEQSGRNRRRLQAVSSQQASRTRVSRVL